MPRRASNGASDTATVSITVVDVNDAPVFVDPTPADGEVLEYEAGMSVELTLAADDPEADAITYGVDPLFDAASLDTATGAFSWPVSWEDAGDHALTLLATDGTNNISRAITVRVTIVDMDDDAVPDDLEASLGLDPTTADTDADGTGDACDADGDGDGVDDAVDNCPDVDNAEQADLDADATGDACDDDDDGDMVADADDACPLEAGDGADGCPAGGTSSGAADEGCGCSSSQPAGVPGNALVLARGGLALLWRRRRRRS